MRFFLQGFDRLADALQWCRDFGVKEVTVYAFSIENFKRSEEEVGGLFDLARQKFRLLIEEEEKLRRHGVCVKVIGNMSYLPSDLQDLVETAMRITEDNSACRLNVAFSYTSREEMTHAIQAAAREAVDGHLRPEDISEDTLDAFMYTRCSPPPDLLIRTSGETRLSDFLLWQSSYR